MSTKSNTLKKAMLIALTKNRCNISKACKAVGIDRATHYKYIKSNPEYAEAVEAAMEAVIDEIESKLQEVGIDGNVLAMNSFLNARGKSRGYGNPSHIIKEVHTKKKLPVSNSIKKANS